MESNPLFFSSQQHLRKKTRTTKIQFPRPNIYTSLFHPSQIIINQDSSRLSINKQPRNYYGFVNPKPSKVLEAPTITFNQVQQPQRRALVSGDLLDIQSRVEVLRRTVSQNKIRSENRLNDLAIRAERLKEKYLQQNKQLGKIVQAINQNFS